MAVDINNSIGSAMKQASSITSNAVSKASSMFTSGLKEDIALVDSTAKSGIASLNAFKDSQLGALDGFIKKVSSGALNVKELSSFIDIRNGFKVDYQGLGKRLGEAAGFPIDSVLNMSTDIKNQAMSLLDAYTNKNYMGLLNSLGIEIDTLDGSYEMASMLSDVMNRYAGDDDKFNQIIDRAAEVSFLNVMLQYAVSAGMWEGIDVLLAQYTIKQDGLDSLANSTQYAIANGDVYTIRACIDRVGAIKVKALNQNAIIDIMRNFRFKAGLTNDQYPNYRTRLIDILNLLEPGWDTRTFGQITARRLEPFTSCSVDVVTLLQYDERYCDQVLMAKLYPAQNLMDLLKANYPTLAIIQ